ncbi:TIGR02206 family membrane protein [Domibacillus robiginosus]|uniref:YwaF family protein n=1 Tax=Domibacillus robiginosus TaxID=1071054 RepID=UPI00067D994A|nr:TIGR02206 family membrane protein [Domibacillus robiginosus]
MGWFSGSYQNYDFSMFSGSHFTVIAVVTTAFVGLYLFRQQLGSLIGRKTEIGTAFFLLVIEMLYHVWMVATNSWRISHAIPLELCSISLFLAVLLLLTHKKNIYDILLFTGLLGASQALLTPYLNFDFPHFRFFHFFTVHAFLMIVPLYFTWVKGYRPTLYSVGKTVLFLNILIPPVMLINIWTGGNYLYLSHKPSSASLLDLLGPYPWYILSLEALALVLSLFIWMLFREKPAGHQTEKLFRRKTAKRAESS